MIDDAWKEEIERRLARIEAALPVRLGPREPDEEEIKEASKSVADLLIRATQELPPPVDRTKQTLTDGSPVPADRSHVEDRGDGQQKGYVVLSAEERAKGFVRPVRRSYVHGKCGSLTTMSRELAETYARDPYFYGGTFCVGCRAHFPVAEFTWEGTDEALGT